MEITNHFGCFRHLVVDDTSIAEEMIGGPGIAVEIDESKISKRKCQRDKCCGDGSWIFRGIERIDEKRFFPVPSMKCDAETLLRITHAITHPESIIMHNGQGPHGDINKLDQGHEHQNVNNIDFFVDPTTGACTNRIESKL